MLHTCTLILLLALCPWLAGQTPLPVTVYGPAGCGSTDHEPTFHTGGRFPQVGDSSFQLHARNLPGQAPGLVLLSTAPAAMVLPGMTLLVSPAGVMTLTCRADGPAAQAGAGSLHLPLPIPNRPQLAGGILYLQGVFIDPAAPLPPLHTRGLRLELVTTASQLHMALLDRDLYNSIITGPQLGPPLWAIHQVPGFDYLGTRQFTCGGQSHWLVLVRHRSSGIEFVLIPGGSFRMGNLNLPGQALETPAHWVRMRPFLLGRTEVTRGTYKAVMNATPWQGQHYVYTGLGEDLCPASYIDHSGATAFCTSLGMRLPSEAEWEYACRAGTTTIYYTADPIYINLSAYEWTYDNTNPINEWYPHQVATRLPNAFGLHDMQGNVSEWVADQWHDNYRRAPADGSTWLGGTTDRLPLRGGNWAVPESLSRSARRYPYKATKGDMITGFRPALSLP